MAPVLLPSVIFIIGPFCGLYIFKDFCLSIDFSHVLRQSTQLQIGSSISKGNQVNLFTLTNYYNLIEHLKTRYLLLAFEVQYRDDF